MLETLERSTFETLLDDIFALQIVDQEDLDLQLVEVKALKPSYASATESREPFSLLFRGPRDRMFHQGTYTLIHADLGELTIFLVPVGPGSDGMDYEAVFN